MADEQNKKKKSFTTKVIFLLAFIVVSFIISLAVAGYLEYNEIKFDTALISTPGFFIPFAVLIGGLIFVTYSVLKKPADKKPKSEIKTENNIKKFYDSHFLTLDELRKQKNFMFHYWEELKTLKIKKSPYGKKSDFIPCGIPIRGELINNRLEVNMYSADTHALIVGTSGSGKSSRLVEPTIHILSETGVKPHLVITDPKGELFHDTSESLKKKGYNVIVFDIDDPYSSTRWNPLSSIYRMYRKAQTLRDLVKVHRGDNPKTLNLKCPQREYYNEWYELDGYALADKQSLEDFIISTKQQLESRCVEELKDVASVIVPESKSNDPYWENSARSFIQAIMTAMLEDSNDPELEMTEDKFNFYNVNQIANLVDVDSMGTNPYKSICKYFNDRDNFSQAKILASNVVNNRIETQQNLFGTITEKLSMFNDMGMCYVTSANEMNLNNFDEQPSALYLRIPDQKVNRYPIAIMFITQLYKQLVEIANTKEGLLDRPCYFIMDEFANMPQIPNFKTVITVSRGRRIFFMLIVQSYVQLKIAYGEDVATTIEDNCNVVLFLATNDQATAQKISEKCGTISFKTTTTSYSSNKSNNKEDKGGESKNESVAIDTRPLIYKEELSTIQKNGQVLILFQKDFPAKSKFTSAYDPAMSKFYDRTPARQLPSIPKRLNIEQITYDIRKINQLKDERSRKNNSSANNSNFGGFDSFNLF